MKEKKRKKRNICFVLLYKRNECFCTCHDVNVIISSTPYEDVAGII